MGIEMTIKIWRVQKIWKKVAMGLNRDERFKIGQGLGYGEGDVIFFWLVIFIMCGC